MRFFNSIPLLFLLKPAIGQQIWDIWSTTWNRDDLFTYTSLAPSSPINFVTPGTPANADIQVNDGDVYQTVLGFGATLTDSSALLLSDLKTQNPSNYYSLLDYLFNATDGANAAGLSYLRVPLGASDFSSDTYNFDPTSGDTSFADFEINTPEYVFQTIKDIQAINQYLRVHILPWSPPGWMKSSGSMDGGNYTYGAQYATYLLKCLQGFKSNGVTSLYAISIQNEPQNSDSTYPSAIVPVAVEAQIGLSLRTLMNNNGFSGVNIIGYEHNWDDAGAYPVTLMQDAASAFAGVAFHCYAGSVSDQQTFYNAYPSKQIYTTECTGTLGSDWWSDIKWYMDNLFIGGPQYYSMSVLMWNLALNSAGGPELPGSDSCGGGCRGVVQINTDGTWSVNQEFYAMAQASKAIIPKDVGGPFGQRIGVTVAGSLDWALVVGAYKTERTSSTAWNRYALVVLNWDDSASTTWNPVAVPATIEFRGMQAAYTFPVGVTTLWWYAED